MWLITSVGQDLGLPRWIHQADGDAAPEAEHRSVAPA